MHFDRLQLCSFSSDARDNLSYRQRQRTAYRKRSFGGWMAGSVARCARVSWGTLGSQRCYPPLRLPSLSHLSSNARPFTDVPDPVESGRCMYCPQARTNTISLVQSGIPLGRFYLFFSLMRPRHRGFVARSQIPRGGLPAAKSY